MSLYLKLGGLTCIFKPLKYELRLFIKEAHDSKKYFYDNKSDTLVLLFHFCCSRTIVKSLFNDINNPRLFTG